MALYGEAMNTTTARPIQPPFKLYTLSAQPGTMNSPAEPAVHLREDDMHGNLIRLHTLTPDQAHALASQLTHAALLAEREPGQGTDR